MRNVSTKLAAIGVASLVAVSGGFIAIHEGYVPGRYIDPAGIATTCFGHTSTAHDESIAHNDAKCLALLADDLTRHNRELLAAVKVPLSELEHIAYLSFHYNVGAKSFRSSTLLKRLNAGDRIGACNELSRWVYADGRRLAGLVRRREHEREFCLAGVKTHGI